LITPKIPDDTPENLCKNLEAIWRGIQKTYFDNIIIESAEFKPNPMRDAWNLFAVLNSTNDKELYTWLIVFQRRDETVHVKGPIIQKLSSIPIED
jgi:hypothetical protein